MIRQSTHPALAGLLEAGHAPTIEAAEVQLSTWAETAAREGYDLTQLAAFAVRSEAGYSLKLMTRHALQRLARNPEIDEFLAMPSGPDEVLAALPGADGYEGFRIPRRGAL